MPAALQPDVPQFLFALTRTTSPAILPSLSSPPIYLFVVRPGWLDPSTLGQVNFHRAWGCPTLRTASSLTRQHRIHLINWAVGDIGLNGLGDDSAIIRLV